MPLLRSRTRTRECMVTASTEMLAGGTISARFDQSSQLLHVALRYLNHSFVHLRASLLASKPALVSFAFAIRLHSLSTFRLRLGRVENMLQSLRSDLRKSPAGRTPPPVCSRRDPASPHIAGEGQGKAWRKTSRD